MRTRVSVVVLAAILAACSGRSAQGTPSAGGTGTDSAAAASVPAAQSSASPGPTLLGERTILFAGTSLTAGLGLDDPDEAYPGVIARRIDSLGLPFRVVNAGVSGETSAGALHRMDWLLRGPVDVFVLETGANDGLRGLSTDSLRANVQAIIDKVHATHPQAKVVLVGMEAPPNLGTAYTSAFHAVFPDLARANGAAFVPFLLEGVAGQAALNQADGIHPTAPGARIVANTVWTTLRPLLDSLSKAKTVGG